MAVVWEAETLEGFGGWGLTRRTLKRFLEGAPIDPLKGSPLKGPLKEP